MRSSHITCTCFSPELFLSTLVSQVWFSFPVNQHWRGKWGKYQQSFPSILFKLVHVLVDVGHLSAGPYAFIKPISNKWVWGRCPSKLREPQASIKVTMTTLWAAPPGTILLRTSVESFQILTKTHPGWGKGWEPKGFGTSTSKDNVYEMNLIFKGAL